jgi:signal transduction histidine kinase
MIVDDSPTSLRTLAEVLGQRGFKVRPVPSGKLALQAAQHNPPDLILLDVNMPEMNGYELCERLKAHEQLQGIPAIFISGMDGVVDKVRAFGSGGVDYVTKPVQLEELEARVRTHLTLRRQARELQMELTERRRAEAELARVLTQRTEEWRQATAAALNASEEEARRIGRELHDTLCQDLIGISRQAEALVLAGVESERVSAALEDRLRRLASLAAAASRRARELSHLLAISEPLDIPLEEALRGHVRQLESLYGFTCELSLGDGLPAWSPEQGAHVLRIIREALVNAVRHAHAHHVWVDCLPEGRQTILSISSDGAPSPTPEMWKAGLGLRQMRMRAALLGAALTFRPGAPGAVVQLILPETPVHEPASCS